MGKVKTAVTNYKGVEITIELVSGKCHINHDEEFKGEYPDLAAAEKAVRVFVAPDSEEAQSEAKKPNPKVNVLVSSAYTSGNYYPAETRFAEKEERWRGNRKYYWVKYTARKESWRKSKEAVPEDEILADTPENRAILDAMREKYDDARAAVDKANNENNATFATLVKAKAPSKTV